MLSEELAGLLWDARTRPEVYRIIDMVETTKGITWRALGDRPNNIGTVGMASEPGLAIVERITNMFDAMLDLGHSLNPEQLVSSPRDAATRCAAHAPAHLPRWVFRPASCPEHRTSVCPCPAPRQGAPREV